MTRAQEDKLLKAHTRLRQQLTIALIERHRVVAALERSEEGSAPAAEAAASESWSRGTPTGGRDSKEELAQADSLGSAASTGSQESGRTHYGGFQVLPACLQITTATVLPQMVPCHQLPRGGSFTPPDTLCVPTAAAQVSISFKAWSPSSTVLGRSHSTFCF